MDTEKFICHDNQGPGNKIKIFFSLFSWPEPKCVFLDVTNYCNLRCELCPQSIKNFQFEKGHMSFAFFRQIMKQLKSVKSFALFSSGEPLLAENWDQILDYFLISRPDIEKISFSTNGTLLDKKVKSLLGKKLDISVSIDGATRNTYESIRKGAHFDRLIRNLRQIYILKKKNNLDWPKLSISFVAWEKNIRELPALVRLASSLGIENITIIHRIFYDKQLHKRYSLCYHKNLFDTNLEKALNLGKKLGINIIHPGSFSRRIPPTYGIKDYYFREKRSDDGLICRISEEQVNIGPTGLVRACCYIDRLFMGNLQFNSFSEIWNGPIYRDFRLKLYRGEYPTGCDTCSFLQVIGKEEQATYYPLKANQFLPLSPKIFQQYSINEINEKFTNIMRDFLVRKTLSHVNAIEHLENIYKIDRNFFEIANNIGVIYHQLGDNKKALFWLGKAIAVNPESEVIDTNLKLIRENLI